mmetsp:Transcript_62712/g.141627  ORF Transcript_62712/g.141627 Transcript_62712/m.141627 type:complete len:174 (+) Transcript_62712:143-664(+)|eukprot:CAMPEP_0172611984 /NCGR_PEP_ID=MMETSP1068-20121228/31611_1 /TAXON_ID=35684 /ORGANISM="Pseudopedinella elastica, Strain CCMP716" /LENGTH=173 /DNA_ID=CAMNT_0013416103 /DNA_START=1107 /DNA_END=1628 /DNA_ORIENTATION=-
MRRGRFILLMMCVMVVHDTAASSDECDVCATVLEGIKGLALVDVKNKPKDLREAAAIDAIGVFCDQQMHLETSQRKMCYYLDPLKQTAARSLLMNMPTNRICRKLDKENPDICKLQTISINQPTHTLGLVSSAGELEDFFDDLYRMAPDFFGNLTDRQKKEILREAERGVVYA